MKRESMAHKVPLVDPAVRLLHAAVQGLVYHRIKSGDEGDDGAGYQPKLVLARPKEDGETVAGTLFGFEVRESIPPYRGRYTSYSVPCLWWNY